MVRVYALRAPDVVRPAERRRLLAAVSPTRRARVLRGAHPPTALRSLLGEALARVLLAARHGRSPARVRWRRGPHGKPFSPEAGAPHFNVAHSGAWIVCALASDAVGVDIEALRPVTPALARRCLTPVEYRAWRRQPADRQTAALIELWTLKESYVKALGTGLTTPLRSFAIRPRDGAMALYSRRRQDAYAFRTYPLDPAYRLSVCVCARAPTFAETVEVLPWAAFLQRL